MIRKMLKMKKCFSAFFAGVLFMSCVNVFAGTVDTVFYDKEYKKSVVSETLKNSPQLVVKVGKDTFKKGEIISVDFKIINNPGFSSYSFKIDYDKNIIKPVSASSESSEVEYEYNSKVFNKAVKRDELKNELPANKNSDGFSVTGLCTNSLGELAEAKGDGTLFSVKFKAIETGKSDIAISGYNNFILADSSENNIPVYVKNFVINVRDDSKGNNSYTESSPKTENASEATEISTETSTEFQSKEETTETQTENTIEKNLSSFIYDNTEENSEDVTEADTEEITYPDFEINPPKPSGDNIEFKDMADFPWAKEAVGFLADIGVVKGVDWRIFKPADFTSKADFMIMVKRFTGIEGQPETNIYSDIKPSDYYADAVGTVSKYGLVKGTSGTEFKPKDNITRQEVISVLAGILERLGKLEKSNLSILDSFIDEDFVSPYAREYMADFIGMGIVSGDDRKKLNPVEPITRAEVCVLIKKVYDLL